jgi:hypothetical protein
LQHHVAEPDLDAWESIDWAALSLGQDALTDEFAVASGNEFETTGFSTLGASSENQYDFGSGYGFVCMYPALFAYQFVLMELTFSVCM